MGLSQQAKDVITRRLPPEKIKQRPGGGGLTFDYVTPDVVIDILNEAFDYQWDSRVFESARENDTVIIGMELKVWGEDGTPITKQQFGSCDITRGLGVGEAFKGAASDALKKVAVQLGVALELYQDEPVNVPATPRTTNAPPPRPAVPAPRAPAPAAKPAPPAPAASPRPVAAPAPPKQPNNPFNGDAPTATAQVPAPTIPAPLPKAPRAAPAPPVAKKADPFGGGSAGEISPTQLNALTNIASRREMSQAELIALAGIEDAEGNPKVGFDELENTEAIKVIRAAQQ